MKWFKMVIKLDPTMLDAYHGFALCAFKKGNATIAAEYLDKAI